MEKVKSAEIQRVISACMGLFVEAVADDYSATPGQQVELAIEAINRSSVDCRLISVDYLPSGLDSAINTTLENNQRLKYWKKITLPADLPLTNPYWLNKKWELGMYNVEDQLLRGLPETPRTFKVRFNLIVADEPISIEKEVIYKEDDDVKGEVYRPFEITPPVSVSLPGDVYLFTEHESRTIPVLVKSGRADVSGNITLCHPEGWRIEPEKIDFELKLKGEEQVFQFELFPPENSDENFIVPLANVDGEGYTDKMTVIEYDHIPTQTVLQDASAKVAKMDLKTAGRRIGYIMGAGDKIPESLRQIGYGVDVLDDNQITAANLRQYDAIVLGVRAYNVVDRMKFHQPKLLEYVEQGGTMVVQYNTNRSLVLPMEEIAPYPLKLSRDRVTVEEAEVRFLAPDHPVLNYPNKITQKDFENWEQERGLYFPDEWSEEFTPILSSNDPGEPARDGGLLVAKYGQGYYVYTGYSWFRELPPGVTGAYRIFANLLALGNREKP